MIRLATYFIGITLILASCNLLSPDAGTPSSSQLASDLISPPPDIVQTGDSDAQGDARCEPVGSTTIPASSDPSNTNLLSSTEYPSAEQTGVCISGQVALDDGSGLANVAIYLSLASYPGEIIATTDSTGNFQSELKFIPGDETVTIWAELNDYTFHPANYLWRHYYGLEERTLNFSASSVSSEALPAWLGTPAAENPPRSELPLPEGVCNGDIVTGQDNLLWFIWENTKSRVWFPGQWSENDLSSLADGSEKDPRIIGLAQPDSASGYLAITDQGNIFWIDSINENRYPLNLVTVSQADLNGTPTAYGEQYYPTLE